jgi:hypothetical protein
MRTIPGIALSLFLVLAVHCFAGETNWKVEGIALAPATELSRHFSASIWKEGVEPTKLEAVVPLTSVQHWFVSGNKLAVLGNASNSGAVVIFDLAQRRLLDWFYCYEPQQVNSDWIAYVEWYPNHTPDITTDVVLLYDLAKTPQQNRIEQETTTTIPPPESARPTRVGIPIYPELNARKETYNNIIGEHGDVRLVLGGPGFVSMPHDRIVFIAFAQPGGDASMMSDQIIVVDLSKGIREGIIESVPIPVNSLPKPPERPDFVRVTGIETVAPDKLRLQVPKDQYGIENILVALPNM